MKHSICCTLFIAFRLSQSFASTQSHKDADGYVNVHVADSDSPVNTDTDTGTAGDSHGGTAHVSGGAHGQADKSRAPLLSPVAVYRKLFRHQRANHLAAVKKIMTLDKYEKQYKMLQLIYTRLFKILEESKVTLTESGFLPGDDFLVDNSTRNAFSNVVENVMFFGDILLRMPDMSDAILRGKHGWELLSRWGVGFCNATNVLERSDVQLLHLMAQELKIVEKDVHYVNPYKEDVKQAQLEAERAAMVRQQKDKAEEKKRKKRKGPRISSIGHGEL